MPERIFLTFTNATAVPYQGSTIGHHIVLNYIDSNGQPHILQGKPEEKHAHNTSKARAFIADAVRPDGMSMVGPPFGKLQSTSSSIASEGGPMPTRPIQTNLQRTRTTISTAAAPTSRYDI